MQHVCDTDYVRLRSSDIEIEFALKEDECPPSFYALTIAGSPMTASSSASSRSHSASRNAPSHFATTTVARQLPTTLIAVRAMSISSSTPRMRMTPSTGRLNEARVPNSMTNDVRGTPATPFEVSMSVNNISICWPRLSSTPAACATKIEASERYSVVPSRLKL